MFTLGGGISGGAVSSNENKFNIFYPLAALYQPKLFHEEDKEPPCQVRNQEGSPLVDIDLKIEPLLKYRVQVVDIGLASDPNRTDKIYSVKNILSQTFSIRSCLGQPHADWKFTTGSVNPAGTFFSTDRERTHQIVFTFGPLSDDGKSLTGLAKPTI